jgi:hypothetical protein
VNAIARPVRAGEATATDGTEDTKEGGGGKPATWQKRIGRMGVAVMRGGVVVSHASAGKIK